jgi:hypothetical protein
MYSIPLTFAECDDTDTSGASSILPYFFLPPFSTNYSSILSHLVFAMYLLVYLSILLFPDNTLEAVVKASHMRE